MVTEDELRELQRLIQTNKTNDALIYADNLIQGLQREGEEIGYSEQYATGYQEGYDSGNADGWNEGFTAGVNSGYDYDG